MNKKIFIAAVLALAITAQTGCSTGSSREAATQNKDIGQEQKNSTSINQENVKKSDEQVIKENRRPKTIEEFGSLMSKRPKVSEAASFIEKNASLATPEEATKMIISFEELQKSYLPELEEKFHKDVTIQEKLMKEFESKRDLSKPGDIKDKQVKELLTEVKEGGYKVETAEGMFFPVIDYSYYKKFNKYISKDIKSYMEIMAVESDKVPAKDAALIITWEEMLNRAAGQERFLKQYESSIKYKDVKKLYDRYVTFALFGLNNTPLFDYETKLMEPDAKKAYSKLAESSKDSYFARLIANYLEVLKKNHYTLTNDVEKFRKDNSPSLE